METQSNTRLLTQKDVEEIVRLSKTSLYRYMRAGQFPEPLRIGPKAVRWRADEVQDWIESRSRSQGDSPGSASRFSVPDSRG